MFVDESILTNVNTSKIIALLRSKNIRKEDGDKGMEDHLWLGKLLNEKK